MQDSCRLVFGKQTATKMCTSKDIFCPSISDRSQIFQTKTTKCESETFSGGNNMKIFEVQVDLMPDSPGWVDICFKQSPPLTDEVFVRNVFPHNVGHFDSPGKYFREVVLIVRMLKSKPCNFSSLLNLAISEIQVTNVLNLTIKRTIESKEMKQSFLGECFALYSK